MKKIITLFILLVMIISLASCDYLPDDIKATIDGAIDGVTGIFGGFVCFYIFCHSCLLILPKVSRCIRAVRRV